MARSVTAVGHRDDVPRDKKSRQNGIFLDTRQPSLDKPPQDLDKINFCIDFYLTHLPQVDSYIGGGRWKVQARGNANVTKYATSSHWQWRGATDRRKSCSSGIGGTRGRYESPRSALSGALCADEASRHEILPR